MMEAMVASLSTSKYLYILIRIEVMVLAAYTTRGIVMVDYCLATMVMAVYSSQKMHGMGQVSLLIKNEKIN